MTTAHKSLIEKYREFNSYSYYDTPDGEDFLKKLWYTTKLGLRIGCAVGGIYGYITWDEISPRFFIIYQATRIAAPFVISSMIYTTTTYHLTQIRKTDDVMNSQLAGTFAGAALGIWFRHPALALAAAAVVGGLCGFKKLKYLKNEEFPISRPYRQYDGPWGLRNLDFGFIKDDPGEFTRVPRTKPQPPPPPPPPPPPKRGMCADFE